MKTENNTTTSTWRTVGIREKIAIITAVVAFTLGWTLTGIAAFVPLFLSE